MELSIVIVSFNCCQILDKCLESLFQSAGEISFEVIVVDNRSSDGTKSMLSQKYPSVKSIFNQENTGFGAGCNQGARAASGEYLFFLNPDALVKKDTVNLLLLALKNGSYGAAGPKLTDSYGKIQYVGARKFPSLLGVFFNLFLFERVFPKSRIFGRNLMGHWDHADSRPVDCLSGAAIMIRRELFEKIGGFDTDYLFYSEDIDLCRKIKNSGENIFYCAEAEVVHAGGASSRNADSKFYEVILFYSNRLYFLKNASRISYYLFNAISILAALSRMVLILVAGAFCRYKETSNFSLKNLKKYFEIFLLSAGFKSFRAYETAFKNMKKN